MLRFWKQYYVNKQTLIMYIYYRTSKNHSNKIEHKCSCNHSIGTLHLSQVDWRGLAPSNIQCPNPDLNREKTVQKKEITLSFEDHCELRSQSTSFSFKRSTHSCWFLIFLQFSTAVNKSNKNRKVSGKFPIFMPVKIRILLRNYTRIYDVWILFKNR